MFGPAAATSAGSCWRLSFSLLPVCFSIAANTSVSGILSAVSVTVVPSTADFADAIFDLLANPREPLAHGQRHLIVRLRAAARGA